MKQHNYRMYLVACIPLVVGLLALGTLAYQGHSGAHAYHSATTTSEPSAQAQLCFQNPSSSNCDGVDNNDYEQASCFHPITPPCSHTLVKYYNSTWFNLGQTLNVAVGIYKVMPSNIFYVDVFASPPNEPPPIPLPSSAYASSITEQVTSTSGVTAINTQNSTGQSILTQGYTPVVYSAARTGQIQALGTITFKGQTKQFPLTFDT